jgi:propionate CoA-transferase
VQVEKVVKAGTLDPKLVKIPGIFVDIIVTASKPQYHMQTFGEQYNPSYSGEVTIPLNHVMPMDMSERKVICRRAAKEITNGSIINLGIGMPEGISIIANEEEITDRFIMTVESGIIGGIPASGLSFGCSTNPQAIINQSGIFDFYHGNGLDIAFLGLAQADSEGNINVSKFGTRVPGCGGFIDITQTAKNVCFCGTFTSGGLEVEILDGKIKILQEGKTKKLVKNVEQITYSGRYARKAGQKVLYITERAVFDLVEEGLRLIEIAPGIDLERDILQQMEFKPIIPSEIKIMDKRLFLKEVMNL